MSQERSQDSRLRLGMVGGGADGFIGAVHRMAARLDDRFELVAGVLSSDPTRGRQTGRALHIPSDRLYSSALEMAQAEAKRNDPIDAVAIVTPNHLHHDAAMAFLGAGIHVMCEKPLATSLSDAVAMNVAAADSGCILAVCYVYSAYPMVRRAKALVASGLLGSLRLVQVEYPQGWLSADVENQNNKQAEWRTDPERSGRAGSLGDIGTHAFHLAEFVLGRRCVGVLGELTRFGPARRLDDDCRVFLHFEGGIRGSLWASQVAAGTENGLQIRLFGERGSLRWQQETPDRLTLSALDAPPNVLTRGGPLLEGEEVSRFRLPAGHPEGFVEALGQLYVDFARRIDASRAGRMPSREDLLLPVGDDGVRGLQFIEAVLDSDRNGNRWTSLQPPTSNTPG